MEMRMARILQFLAIFLLWVAFAQGSWHSSTAAMMLRPAAATVTAVDSSIAFHAAPVSLAVTVGDVQDLGAATIVVAYDPAVLTPTGCRRGESFGFGLCNLAVDLDADGTNDAVRFNVLALSGVTVSPDAAAPLATIDWRAISQAAIGTSTPLTVTIDTLTDSAGIPLPASAQNGSVTVLPAPIYTLFLPLITS